MNDISMHMEEISADVLRWAPDLVPWGLLGTVHWLSYILQSISKSRRFILPCTGHLFFGSSSALDISHTPLLP